KKTISQIIFTAYMPTQIPFIKIPEPTLCNWNRKKITEMALVYECSQRNSQHEEKKTNSCSSFPTVSRLPQVMIKTALLTRMLLYPKHAKKALTSSACFFQMER